MMVCRTKKIISHLLCCFVIFTCTMQSVDSGLLTGDLKLDRRPVTITRHSPVCININSDGSKPSLLPLTLPKPAKPPPNLLTSLSLPYSNPLFTKSPFSLHPPLLRFPAPILPPLLPKLPFLPIVPPILPLLPLLPLPPILPPLIKPLRKPLLGRPFKPISVPILGKKTPLEKLLDRIRLGKLKRNLGLHRYAPIF